MAWRSQASPGSGERGAEISRRGLVRFARNVPGRAAEAAVTSSDGESEYFVLVRYLFEFHNRNSTLSLPHCICSCPDKRQGYCKHSAAVLKDLAGSKSSKKGQGEAHKPQKPAWMLSAYSTAAADPVKAATPSAAAVSWSKKVQMDEERMRKLGLERCREFLKDTVSLGSKESQEMVSLLFGGRDAQSESYQNMACTKQFDTWNKIAMSSADHIYFALLLVLYDLCDPKEERRFQNLQAITSCVDAPAAVTATATKTIAETAGGSREREGDTKNLDFDRERKRPKVHHSAKEQVVDLSSED